MPDFANSRILVTGGAGFIGSALVWALNQRGATNIVITDVLDTGEKWRNLVPLRFADYLDAADLFQALESNRLGTFDYILHMGACSSTTERDAAYLMRNNFEYTKRLAAHALSHQTRFVYASSAATYGDGSHGMSDTDDASLPQLRPLNMYGYSKHLFDLHARQHGFLGQICGLKFFNVFGPNENHKGDMRSLVNKAYDQVLESGEIRLFKSYRPEYADGHQRRDFLYVKDAVEMTLHLAQDATACGVYNIGSGHASTWVELAHAVFAALGKEPRIVFIDMPESLQAKYQYFTQADIGKLRSFGYRRAVTSLGDAVMEYVTKYLVTDRRLGDEAQG